MENSNHRKQVSWSLFDQALVSGTNFLLGIILIRLLGLEQYGIYVLLWMLVQFFASIQSALIISPMMSIAPKKPELEKVEYLSNTMLMQVAFVFLLVFFLTLLAFIPESYRPNWLSNQALLPLLASTFFFQFQTYIRRQFFVSLMPEKAFSIDLLAYGLQIPVIFIVLTNYPSFVNALLVVAACMSLSIILAIRWLHVKSYNTRSLYFQIKHHWTSSKWLLGAAITQWLSGNYFLIVAGAVLGPVVVGAIKAAQNIIGITHIVFQALENVVPSEASRRLHKEGLASLKSYISIVSIVLFVGTGLTAIAIGFNAEPILLFVYGSLDKNSIDAMLWFIPIYLLTSLNLAIFSGLRAIEKTKSIFLAYFLSSLFALFFANHIVSEYQVTGVMFGLLITQIIIIFTVIIALIINFHKYK